MDDIMLVEQLIRYSLVLTILVALFELICANRDGRVAGFLAFLHSLALSISYGYESIRVMISGIVLEHEVVIGLATLPLKITPLSAPLILITCIVAPFISLYSINYLHYYGLSVRRFYPAYSTTLLSVLVFFSAGDFITLLIAMEASSILTGLLVAYKLGERELYSAIRYIFVFLAVGKLAFLGAGLIWMATGSIELPESLRLLGVKTETVPALSMLAIVLLLVAFATKATLAPMSFWLIWAMDAPSNVSALFHFGIIILMGVYGLTLLLIPALESQQLAMASGYMIVTGGITAAVISSTLMLATRDIKHLIGLSTIENAGLVATCIGTSMLMINQDKFIASLLIMASYLHSLAHAYSKAAMFMNAGCFILAAHSRHIPDLAGLAKRLPWTALIMVVIISSLLGLPPSLMFASSIAILLSLLLASVKLKVAVFAVFSVIVSHALSSLAYLRLIKTIISENSKMHSEDFKDDFLMLSSQAGLISLSYLSLGLFPAYAHVFKTIFSYLELPYSLSLNASLNLYILVIVSATVILAISAILVNRK